MAGELQRPPGDLPGAPAPARPRPAGSGEEALHADVSLLAGLLDEGLREHRGEAALECIRRLRDAAVALRSGLLAGGRDAFASLVESLDLEQTTLAARTFAHLFHLTNCAEEQHRIRVLRRRDVAGEPPGDSIAAACRELHRAGITAEEIRRLLDRSLVMPVLTAHPTEARRRTVLDHLEDVAGLADRLDDPRLGAGERQGLLERLQEAVLALESTAGVRAQRPSPLDEIQAGLHIFERTLFQATPAIYRTLEDALTELYPGEGFAIGPFLQWGSWIGGDRDGNPYVTAEVTRAALEQQRAIALGGLLDDVWRLGRQLSVRSEGAPPAELEASLESDRSQLPGIAAQARRFRDFEPWREKLWFMKARLEATRARAEGAYSSPDAHLADLQILGHSLRARGLARLARGSLRDAVRRAQVFGFHLASLDLRQHSEVHQAAVAEVLGRLGLGEYRTLGEAQRIQQLAGLLDQGRVEVPRRGLSPPTADLLRTLEVAGQARRELGPRTCQRYVVSFTRSVSDLLEVLLLARVAGLAAGEIRPVPLLEQLEDLERAQQIADGMLRVGPIRSALQGELEVMLGYSDSGKQAGYVPSAVAIHQAQEALARTADLAGVVLTVFHGRGGAVGRGGGPASRAIRAQPRSALRGRLRVTEQGETIAARYGRLEIAQRDLEQMISAVLLGSLGSTGAQAGPGGLVPMEALGRGASAALDTYRQLTADGARLAAYVAQVTPMEAIAELRIGSRPAARRPNPSLESLRAIPWVFSWNQTRHGLPGWFGLGSALEVIAGEQGPECARRWYAEWPFFRALVDNAQLALARADIDVAEHYSRLAEPGVRELFDLIRVEHERTMARVLEVTGRPDLLAEWPTLARTVRRRNPYVDVLNHLQIGLLRRLRSGPAAERPRIRHALSVTISGIAAGLQTAG